MTFEEAEVLLNSQEIERVAAQMRQWHPSILAEMLKAVTFARYQRYLGTHPDWTAAVREVMEKAGIEEWREPYVRDKSVSTGEIDYGYLPDHLRPGMLQYIEHGHVPGHFLYAVLTNDLLEALGRADETSKLALHDIAKFLYNEAPSGCWGTAEFVRRWAAHKGLEEDRS